MRTALYLELRGDFSWPSLVFPPNKAARCGNMLFCISPLLNYLYLPVAQNTYEGIAHRRNFVYGQVSATTGVG